jgi:hypothetical protein
VVDADGTVIAEGSLQETPELIPGEGLAPGFDIV